MPEKENTKNNNNNNIVCMNEKSRVVLRVLRLFLAYVVGTHATHTTQTVIPKATARNTSKVREELYKLSSQLFYEWQQAEATTTTMMETTLYLAVNANEKQMLMKLPPLGSLPFLQLATSNSYGIQAKIAGQLHNGVSVCATVCATAEARYVCGYMHCLSFCLLFRKQQFHREGLWRNQNLIVQIR